jgi:hypothetical protein
MGAWYLHLNYTIDYTTEQYYSGYKLKIFSLTANYLQMTPEAIR